jgi:hypothetical protein
MKEIKKRFSSRKFILACVASGLIFANSYFDLGLSQSDIQQILTPILTFMGIEGLNDVIKTIRK